MEIINNKKKQKLNTEYDLNNLIFSLWLINNLITRIAFASAYKFIHKFNMHEELLILSAKRSQLTNIIS